ELGGVDIPGTLESLKNNIGVNMSSADALPLGSTEAYHDARDLFSFSLEDLAGEYKDDIAPEIFNKLSDELGSDGMDELLTIIRLTKNVNNDQAVEFLTDLCGDAVDKIAGFGTLAASGDPYFSVEGIKLRVTARCFIPGGKGSGIWTLYFTESGQEQTINFRDITPFIEDGDKLKVVIDEIMYEFRLRQGMNAQLGISLATVNLDNTEKVVSYVQSAKKFTESDFKLEIPLSPSDSLIQGLRVHPGCVSASVNWTSPSIPVKGTVKAYNSSNKLIKTVTESTFKNAHNVIVTDLKENMDYHFEVNCVDASGQSSPVMTAQTTTKANCEPREDQLSIAATNKYEAFELTSPTATAGTNYIEFSWTTNTPGSTEALVSPSPDLSANYVACVKKANGTVVQGWVTREGERKIETSHQMMVTDLEPGTLYYYNIKSWRFDNNDPTDNPTFAVGKVGQISTQALPPTPTVKVKAVFGGQPVSEIPVIALRNGDPSFRLAVNTESTGFTPIMTLPNNCSYTFSVKNHAYYQDVTSSNLYLSNTTQGPQSDIILQLTARPSPGGYVYDSQGNPLQGAAVKIVGKSYQTTTNAAGHYTFEGFSFQGAVTVEVSKANYVTKRIDGEVAVHGLVKQFSADNCILPSALAKLNLTVKNNTGTPINNADVIIKEGNTKLGATLKTNAQGKVTFSNNFNDNNANYHNLTIQIQPAAGSGIAGVTTEMPIVGGSEQSLEINCPQDTQGPMITNLVIIQHSETQALVSFDSSEDGTYKVIYKEPGSNTERSTSLLSLAIADNKYIGGQTLNFDKTGTYKVKVKVTDRNGNETQTDWTDLVFYTGTFRFTSPGTTTSSI
ncbi:MAG: carboxypeptidase regulatory-like domain-containing protein, partial [Phycisphaerae bacterium]